MPPAGDLHQVRGEWPIPCYYPLTAGHEIAGIVEAVGPRCRLRWQRRDGIAADPSWGVNEEARG